MQSVLPAAAAAADTGPWGWRLPPAYCGDAYLPADPRCWSRADVAAWLRHMAAAHRLPEVPGERFLMNGKALCLMSMDMFLGRVPLGGKLLYKDFQLRLGRAMYSAAAAAAVASSSDS